MQYGQSNSHSEYGEARNSARGPLIAVIKIEIDPSRTDRIFLHQRDNDLRLAQSFVSKHLLNPILAPHIHQRIQFSRQSVEQTKLEPVTPHRDAPNSQRGASFHPRPPGNYSNSNFKIQTPINHIDPEAEVYTDGQFFGNTNRASDRFEGPSQPPTRRLEYEQKDYLFSDQRGRRPRREEAEWYQAPTKKDIIKKKEFMIYDDDDEQIAEEQASQVNLFGKDQQTSHLNSHRRVSTAKKEPETFNRQFSQMRSSDERVRNALDIINQQQKENTVLHGSKSMMKLTKQQPVQVQQIIRNSSKPALATHKGSDFDKPSRVKIIIKQQLQSLNQSLKKSKSRHEIGQINRDVTKRLYNQADIKKNYLHLIKEKARKDKEREVDVELTLKPQINKVSRVIAEGRRRGGLPIEDYLLEEGRKADSKKAEINHLQLMRETQHCSFKPELNIISQKLTADKQNLQSRLKEASLRRSSYKDGNTFHPSLNKVTTELMKDKGTFQDRQRLYLQSKNQKLMDLVQQRRIGQRIDLKTGQQLFKPMINDLQVRGCQGSNIGNYLYLLSKQANQTQQSPPGKPRISQTSEAMVQQMYLKRITWLFSQLDSDQDGVISPQSICIDSISPELLDIIKPVLFEMEEIDQELTLIQFKNAVDILHRKLNMNERGVLYNYRQKRRGGG